MRWIYALLVFVPVGLFAEEERELGRFFSEFLNMMMTLGLIIGVMLLIAWVVKRVLHTKIEQMNETSRIKILERRILAPKSNVYLLEIEGKKIIVGETPAGLSHLGELTE